MSLIKACHNILENGESGDLAGAVSQLESAIRDYETESSESQELNISKQAFIYMMGKKFELSELNAQELFKPLVSLALDGSLDPLEAWLFLGFIEHAASTASKQLKPAAISEAYKYPSRSGVIRGSNFMVKQTGDRFDYEGHPLVVAVKDMVKLATKAHLQGREFIDDKTGQVIKPAELKTRSKETIQHGLSKWKGKEI